MDDYQKYERLFGLIGYPLSHSFSKRYFAEKFAREGIRDSHYELFPIEAITQLRDLIDNNPNLVGLNVTIPYKEAVIPYLDVLAEGAREIGAVNTIRISRGRLTGFNTDVYGFEQSLLDLIGERQHLKALILGTGGASKAVAFVLNRHDISWQLVSRQGRAEVLSYATLNEQIISDHLLIINTTPLGMSPRLDSLPDIPYEALTADHCLYDLVYNPEETSFMKKGVEKGSAVSNGLKMLYLQAEKAWEIWNR